MRRRGGKSHYIREWRQRRKLSLRQLANRMESEPGGDPIISHVQIGRIERGENNYTQETLEALALALDVSVGDLLSVNPDMDGEIIDLLRHIPEDRRADAIKVLRALAS